MDAEVDHTAAARQRGIAGPRLVRPVGVVEDEVDRIDVTELAGVGERLHAGRECVFEASFYGTRGGASIRNVAGSFYDFGAERYDGTQTRRLVDPPDAWGGRAAVDWARRLGAGEGFDPAARENVRVHEVLDRVYGRTQ